MPVTTETGRKSERLGLRTSDWQRSLLVAASKAEGTTVSEFVLKHATRAAENLLADRRVFMLSDEAWESFNAALDRPDCEVAGLQELMAARSALEVDADS